MVTLKNFTSNQIKRNPLTYYFIILLANKLLTFANNFIQIYNLQTIKNLLPTPSFTNIQNKPGHFLSFCLSLRFLSSTTKDKFKRELWDHCRPLSCQMAYNIRPEHKYHIRMNKCSKIKVGKKRCRARPLLFLCGSLSWNIKKNLFCCKTFLKRLE